MSKRLELHNILLGVFGSDSPNSYFLQSAFPSFTPASDRYVYFQPPSTVKMKYPCIVYSRSERNSRIQVANGKPYIYRRAYKVTHIDPNPDSAVIDALVNLPYCRYETHFNKDNLNHDVFTIFY